MNTSSTELKSALDEIDRELDSIDAFLVEGRVDDARHLLASPRIGLAELMQGLRLRPETCSQCVFWKADPEMFTVTGWKGAGRGRCFVETLAVERGQDEPACRHGESR